MHDCVHATFAPMPIIHRSFIRAAFDFQMVLCRYFTVPIVMIVLHMKPPTRLQAGVIAGLFALVNAVVLYVFLLRPFRWHDGSIARFMF